MNTNLIFPAALAAFALASGSLQASAPSRADRREIQSDFQRFTAAEATLKYDKIKPVVESFFSPSFVLHTPSGKTLSYAQFLQEMQAVTQENRDVKEDAFTPQSATMEGNTLTETGVYVFSRTFIDVDKDFGPLNQPHSLSERIRYRSVWTKTGGHWKMQRMDLLGRTQIVDGKPFAEKTPVAEKTHG